MISEYSENYMYNMLWESVPTLIVLLQCKRGGGHSLVVPPPPKICFVAMLALTTVNPPSGVVVKHLLYQKKKKNQEYLNYIIIQKSYIYMEIEALLFVCISCLDKQGFCHSETVINIYIFHVMPLIISELSHP